MGLEGHHPHGQTAVLGLAAQQRQHGLMAAMHAIEIADGQGAGLRQVAMPVSAKDSHEPTIIPAAPGTAADSRYIDG
jgi:hypothetical protein